MKYAKQIVKLYYYDIYLYNIERSGTALQRVTWEYLPMIEDALRESLAACVRTQIGSETERFVYGQIGFDDEHRCTGHLLFFEYVPSSSIQDAVDTAYSYFGTLERNKEFKRNFEIIVNK